MRKIPFVFCPTCGERVYCVDIAPNKTIRDVCSNGHWVRYDVDANGYVQRDQDEGQGRQH